MKRIILLLIIIVIMFSMTGCANTSNMSDEENNRNVNTNINVNESNNVVITIDGKEVKGILLDTELAKEVKAYFPLTVRMVKYGNREYYGSIDFEPVNITGGKKSFEEGDITYCPQNNTLAIFYNGKEMPNLTMDVIKIGEITDDLEVFYDANSNEDIIFNFIK